MNCYIIKCYIVPLLTISSILIDVYFTNLIFIGVIFNSYNYWYLLSYSNQFTLHYSILFFLISIILSLLIIGFLTFLFNYFFLTFFFVSIIADSNRVPHDLPEAESELVAGFITEYSTIYFSLILLTEYINIIALTYLIIFVFSIYPLELITILYLISLIRSTSNRLKFDELMTSAWIVILAIIFSFLLLSIIIHAIYYPICYISF